MAGEFEGTFEKSSTPKSRPKIKGMTLEKAVEMGEYDPEYLSIFPEWHKISKIMKWNYVRQALKIRKSFLLQQWAAIFNSLDFSQKPHLAQALKNIEKQQAKVQEDEERLQVEFSA